MSQVDTYRNTYSKKKEELAKLQNDLTKEDAKILEPQIYYKQ